MCKKLIIKLREQVQYHWYPYRFQEFRCHGGINTHTHFEFQSIRQRVSGLIPVVTRVEENSTLWLSSQSHHLKTSLVAIFVRH